KKMGPAMAPPLSHHSCFSLPYFGPVFLSFKEQRSHGNPPTGRPPRGDGRNTPPTTKKKRKKKKKKKRRKKEETEE
ncbi:hypothetical protein, partial [Aeromonas caviae]|uniref:hypothetical protein n=1 Tax=Aeromonas caviae TaxID=648 RepID=UPI001C87421D